MNERSWGIDQRERGEGKKDEEKENKKEKNKKRKITRSGGIAKERHLLCLLFTTDFRPSVVRSVRLSVRRSLLSLFSLTFVSILFFFFLSLRLHTDRLTATQQQQVEEPIRSSEWGEIAGRQTTNLCHNSFRFIQSKTLLQNLYRVHSVRTPFVCFFLAQ